MSHLFPFVLPLLVVLPYCSSYSPRGFSYQTLVIGTLLKSKYKNIRVFLKHWENLIWEEEWELQSLPWKHFGFLLVLPCHPAHVCINLCACPIVPFRCLVLIALLFQRRCVCMLTTNFWSCMTRGCIKDHPGEKRCCKKALFVFLLENNPWDERHPAQPCAWAQLILLTQGAPVSLCVCGLLRYRDFVTYSCSQHANLCAVFATVGCGLWSLEGLITHCSVSIRAFLPSWLCLTFLYLQVGFEETTVVLSTFSLLSVLLLMPKWYLHLVHVL